MKRKILAAFLGLCMIISVMPVVAFAAADDVVYHSNMDMAAVELREDMKARKSDITIYYQMPSNEAQAFEDNLLIAEAIYYKAVEHTGKSDEGDSLGYAWLAGGQSATLLKEENEICYYELTFNFEYTSDAAQEEMFYGEAYSLLDELDVYASSDYEKVKAVYDWICLNVSYDASEPVNYSAYGALIYRRAACEGYALLFYRLMLELGVDCRYIGGNTSDGYGQVVNHGWNLVRIGGKYYQVDTTWGAGLINGEPDYYYLLKGADGMLDHRIDQSRWDRSIGDYCEIAEEDYPVPGRDSVLVEGRCTDTISFSLTGAGVLTVSGTGELSSCYEWPDWNVYEYNDYIRHVVVEEGITDIGQDGLQCGELITAELPDSLESLGANAVDAQIFHIPKNLSSIDPTCFNTTALRSVSVEPGNKNYRVYDNCLFSGDMKTLLRYNPVIDYYGNARTEYCVPDGVETIGDKAFSFEKSLKKISMADSVRNIGANAFTQCGMADVDSEADIVIELTDSIVSIGDGAFNECPALHYVYIGKNVEYIGKSALAGHFISDIQLHPDNKFFTMRDGVLFSSDMTKLIRYPAPRTDTHYDIPEGVVEICDSAFRGFVSSMVSHGNLETVTFPESLVRIGDAAFAEQCNLTKLELPDKLEYIGDHAFSEVGVGKVDSIVIPDSVKYIGEAAFYFNTAKTVVIGSGVEIIGGGAFAADGRPDSNAEPDIRIYFRGTAPMVDVNSHYRPFGFAGYFEDPSVQLYYPAEYKAVWVPGINTQWCPDEQQKEIYFNAVPYHLTEEGEIHYCQTKNNGLTCEEEGNISCVCEECRKVFYSSAAKECVWGEWYCSIEPTETEYGEDRRECQLCGRAEIHVLLPFNHKHSYVEEVHSPSCDEFGYILHVCSECGDSYIYNYIAMSEHQWDGGKITKEPTEDSEGVKLYTCAVCGGTRSEAIDKLEHTHKYTDKVNVPSCTEDGYTTHSCACGYSYTDSKIAAKGHKWDGGTITKEPTEDSEGAKLYICAVCGDTKSETIARLEHTHKYTSKVTAPNCTEQGYTTYICACGESYVDNYVSATGHKAEADAAVGATCTESGLTAGSHCSVCGVTIKAQETVPAKGHKWDNGTVTKPATEKDEGVKTFKCTVCGQAKTQSIPVTSHTHKYTSKVTAPTCTEDGYTTHTCACGDSYKDTTVPAIGHKWDNGKVTKQPTTAAEGEKTFACTVCKETKIEKIDKLPEDKPDDPKPVDNPFKDVAEKDYYFEPVMWAVEKGVTSGLSADSFGPAAGCTRAQVVTFLWRAAGEPAPTSNVNPFKDVKEGVYYYNAVLWAVENGITTGLSADTFGPNANCNRGQIVTFLWRAKGKPVPANSANPFTDVPETQYYYDAVLWAVEKGITTGMSATGFEPNSTCTRGQIVTFLYRAYK